MTETGAAPRRSSFVLRPSSAVAAPTLVVLDQRLDALGHGLDLDAIARWLQETVRNVSVCCVPEPGGRAAALGRVLADRAPARLVLGLASRSSAVAEVQTQARLAGLDPLGVESVDLGTHAASVHPRPEATEKAKLLLAAAVARARAFPGSRPEMVKPHLPATTSRRFAFALPRLQYHPVPWVARERCAAESGCRLCVRACRASALRAIDGEIRLHKPSCDGCGLCVSACPREAVILPGEIPAQLEAELTALLDPRLSTLSPRGILFTCRHHPAVLEGLAQGGCSFPPGWLPVQVSCVGALSPIRLLACLAAGAAAVVVVTPNGGCPEGQQPRVAGRVAFCQEFLRLLGSPAPPMALAPAAAPELASALGTVLGCAASTGAGGAEQPAASPAADSAATPTSAELWEKRRSALRAQPASLILQLAHDYAAPRNVALVHRDSLFGLIEVTESCTGCGVCAEACPTQALRVDRTSHSVALTFDAAQCVACGQCCTRCPEAAHGVIRLRRVTDLQRLAQGSITLHRNQSRQCAACGGPIAGEALLERVAALLGDAHVATVGLITRYCASCRGAATVAVPGARGAPDRSTARG